ncbi:MAG: nucleotidyltransferase domain-containing protein [archaeon]
MQLKEQILELFFKNTEKEYYVREIARILKKAPTTISKYLKELEKEGLLIAESKFNHLIFRSSKNNKFREIKAQYNLNFLNNSGFIDYLTKEFNEPNAIILFGSFAKGEDIETSDIDLFVQSPLKKQIKLEEFEKKLKREIQIFIYNKEETNKLKRNNSELFNNIINGKIIYGNLEL